MGLPFASFSIIASEKLLASLVRLPDGDRYAKRRRPRAVPGLADFLPKSPSGKTRKDKDIDKPTGRIYTEADLLRQLEESYKKAAKA